MINVELSIKYLVWKKIIKPPLQHRHIKHFCFVTRTRGRCIYRIKALPFPLSSSYIFVKANAEVKLHKQTFGVVYFVNHCNRKRASNQDANIPLVKHMSSRHDEAGTQSKIEIGDRSKLENGLLLDWQGEDVKITGKSVVMLDEELNCASVMNPQFTTLTFI